MADAPPWMTLSEIEGALQPGTDCEEAYLYLEKGTSHSRHRLLMNMLVLNPDEMVEDKRDEERTKRMEFYFDKTNSWTPEHLQHKVHLYKVATNLQRADDAYMCELMGVPYTEDEEMPEAANDEAETAGAEPAGAGSAAADATLPTLYESEGDDDDQVEEGSAGHTQYTVRDHGHHAEDDADQRFAARYWEDNARSLAEERREAAELAAAHGNDLAAPVPPGEPPQPPSSAEPSGAAGQSIEPPRPLIDEPTDGQSSKETSAEQSRAEPSMANQLRDETARSQAEDEEMPEAANDMAGDEAMSSGDDEAETAGAEPAGAGASGASSPVAAATVTNAEVEESPPLQLNIQSDDCNQETKHGDGEETAGAEPAGAGAAGVAATVTNPEVTNGAGNDLAAPVPPGEPPQPPSSAVHEPSGAAEQSIEPPRPLIDEPTDGQSSKETSAELSSSKPKAVAADAHQDVVKGAAIAAAAPDDAARLEAAAGYARTMHGLTSQPDDSTNGARSLNEAMALKANDCSMPDRGVEPSDPRASRDLAWLLAHHNALNLTDAPVQWHLAIQEFQHSTFFEQETFAGVAGVRGGDSPLMLACTPIVFRKDGQNSRTRQQSTPDLPGGLVNINVLSMSADRMAHAMRASVSQSAFESVTLKSVGTHPYVVVAFVQLFTHMTTFKNDEEWLEAQYPKLVQLLYGPVAIVMAYKEPRQLLLVSVDDLRPGLDGMKIPPPTIFKAGTTAIRAMIAKMITEEKGKLRADANDKMLFAAEWPNGRESGLSPRSKLDQLVSMQWAIGAFRASSMLTGNGNAQQEHQKAAPALPAPKPKKQKLDAPSNNDSPNSSAGSSMSTVRPSAHQTKPPSSLVPKRGASQSLVPSTMNSDPAVMVFDEDDIASLSESLREATSPSKSGPENEIMSSVNTMMARARDRLTFDAEPREVVFKYLSTAASKLVTEKILPTLERMKIYVALAKNPLKVAELEAIKVEADQYERTALSAIELLHGECKRYKHDYTPQTGTKSKVQDAKSHVHTAVDEAREKLNKAAASKAKKAKLSVDPFPPLVAQPVAGHAASAAQGQAALAAQQREIAAQQAAGQAALAAQQREIAAKLETIEANSKRTAERERESQRQAAELNRVENLALDASNRAALALQSQVAAVQSALESKEKAEQEAHKLKIEMEETNKKLIELQTEQAVRKAQREEEAKGREALEAMRQKMEERMEANDQQLNQLKVENAKTVATMETKDAVHLTVEQLQNQLTQALVGQAHMKGAFTGLFASGGGGGPSGSNNAQWLQANLQPLLMGGSSSGDGLSAPPRPPELMPPPPPRPRPGDQQILALKNKGGDDKDAAGENVPEAVQSLISEIQEAQNIAVKAEKFIDAARWAEWKRTLLQTSHKIATLTDLQKQHAAAENYAAAFETKAERETMETTLAEDMTQVRALLDERRSQS